MHWLDDVSYYVPPELRRDVKRRRVRRALHLRARPGLDFGGSFD